MRSIRIPQDRIGAIIGPKGSTKRMIQKISGITIDIDNEEGEVFIHDEKETADPLMALKIMDVIKAIGRGFAPD
ncbi:MAG: RNA-processing protein, partial [Candidatus Methanomethylophilaceae archaeon]|nr:RNA-processing protein [Candidatus Methanomethylophilaceae archaeon]